MNTRNTLAPRITWPLVTFSALLLLVAVAVGVDIQIARGQAAQNHSPVVQATPTPRLVIHTPRVLAAYSPSTYTYGQPSSDPASLSVTSDGPFDILAGCNPFGYGAGSMAPISFTIVDANGHVVDQVQLDICGQDASVWATYTRVVPEALPAGTYDITNIFGPSVTLIVLDASA